MPEFVFTDSSLANNPIASGYKLFQYTAGTSTKVNTYTDLALTVPNANPIVLPTSGRATIFLTPGQSYKLVLSPPSDTDPPASPIWTYDNINGISIAGSTTDQDVSATAGETLSSGQVVYMSDGSGGLIAGKWYRASATNNYSSTTARMIGILPAAIASGSTGSVRLSGRLINQSGLTPGTVYYIDTVLGGLNSTPPTNARAICFAESATTVIISPWIARIEQDSPDTLATSWGGIHTFRTPPQMYAGSISTSPAVIGGVLNLQIGTIGNVDTTEANGFTFTLKGGTLSANGKAIRIWAGGKVGADANIKTLRFYYGAQTSGAIFTTTQNGQNWWAQVLLIRQASALSYLSGTAVTQGDTNSVLMNTAIFTQDTTMDAVVKFTLQSNMAVANDMTQNIFMVEAAN